MHSALFVVSMPNDDKPWLSFLAYSSKLKNAARGQRLAENVWLLNLQESVEELAALISYAEQLALPYGILPFDAEPQWLPADFDPKTIQGRNV